MRYVEHRVKEPLQVHPAPQVVLRVEAIVWVRPRAIVAEPLLIKRQSFLVLLQKNATLLLVPEGRHVVEQSLVHFVAEMPILSGQTQMCVPYPIDLFRGN